MNEAINYLNENPLVLGISLPLCVSEYAVSLNRSLVLQVITGTKLLCDYCRAVQRGRPEAFRGH